MATVFLPGLIGVTGTLVVAAVTGGKHVDTSCGAGTVLIVTAIKFSAGDRNIFVLIVAVKGHILAHFH